MVVHGQFCVTPVAGAVVNFRRMGLELVTLFAAQTWLIDHVYQVTTGTADDLLGLGVQMTGATPLKVCFAVPGRLAVAPEPPFDR
jgi:hypothetical protein